jgi:rod shape determining protein RodA
MKWNPFERLYWPLFLTTLFMSLLGAVMVYSAAAPDSSESFAVRQLAWIGMGIIAMFFILLMSYRNILNMSYVFYVLGLVMLAGVLVLGHTRMGAQRWIALGPFVLQPSEFFKIILILTLAHYLGNSEKNLYQLTRFFMCFFITVIPLVLVLKQPDLGTALIFLPILFCLLFVWGARLRFFLIKPKAVR